MLLIGYSWIDVVLWTLYVSLIIIVVVIVYRKILGHLAKDEIKKEDYCELNNLDYEPASGELTFYFTSAKKKEVRLLILDSEMNDLKEIYKKECSVGGNIVRYDSTTLSNGEYFYCLKTDNQKTMKKMTIKN